MKSRCLNPHVPQYPNYGGRGVTVCDAWSDSFETFLADMGRRPSPAHSLDRINVDGNYEPSNCRWATNLQQQRNHRKNRRITFRGETKCLSEWAESIGLGRSTLSKRFLAGWDVERALMEPLNTTKRHR